MTSYLHGLCVEKSEGNLVDLGRVLDALPGLSSGKMELWRKATAARSGQDVRILLLVRVPCTP